MDRKTLEYMESKVNKAKNIVNRINELKRNVLSVSSKGYMCLDVKIESRTIRPSEWNSKCLYNSYEAELEAKMLNAFINVTNAEIERLEYELAEL